MIQITIHDELLPSGVTAEDVSMAIEATYHAPPPLPRDTLDNPILLFDALNEFIDGMELLEERGFIVIGDDLPAIRATLDELQHWCDRARGIVIVGDECPGARDSG